MTLQQLLEEIDKRFDETFAYPKNGYEKLITKDKAKIFLHQEISKAYEAGKKSTHNCDQNIESNMTEAHCKVCGLKAKE